MVILMKLMLGIHISISELETSDADAKPKKFHSLKYKHD